MSFIDTVDSRYAPLWETIRSHPFLVETRDGTIPHETFATWMRQDYLFVEAAIPFIGALLPRAPQEHWGPLAGIISALEKELKLFEERAAKVEVDLRGAPPAFACHAYVQFLLSTGAHADYPVAWTVLYAAEAAYHESWKVVKEGLEPDSPWAPFVENWAGEEFAGYVGWLGGELERLAQEASPGQRDAMAEAYRLTLLYEIAFWEMAHGAEGWPGTDDDLAEEGREGPRWNPDPESPAEGAWSHMSRHTGESRDD